MIVFGHHTEGIFQVEILGREFPNGMTEHVLAFGATAVVVALLAYGAWAVSTQLDFLPDMPRLAAFNIRV